MLIDVAVRMFWLFGRLGMGVLLLENWRFRRRSSLVLRSPVTEEYSQDRMPKKRAPVVSCPMALLCVVKLFFHMCWKTCNGRHFWCFVDGSVCL